MARWKEDVLDSLFRFVLACVALVVLVRNKEARLPLPVPGTWYVVPRW